jgi:uncharacterized protein (TIGR02246 family)
MMAERTEATIEDEVRGVLDGWAEATRAKDIDGIMARYAPDVLAFDCHSALQFKGRAALRRHLEACLSAMRGPMTFEIHELDVAARDDLAFGHFVARCGGTGPDGEEHAAWLRVTVCLRRMDGRWLIVHDHCSTPFDPATTRALLDLAPGDAGRVAAA